MKTTIRRSHERGSFDFGWLKTYHTFSFGEFYDPQWMGYKSLRVINEDFIAPHGGFAPHGHKDMEIISYVIKGELKHEDSMGNGSSIFPNEAQYMSAGSGVRHSEKNPSSQNETHLLQIWIQPSEKGLSPRYQQIQFQEIEKINCWKQIASPDGRNRSLAIRQDVHIYASILKEEKSLEFLKSENRSQWLQVISGNLEVISEGQVLCQLNPGDAIAFEADKNKEQQIQVISKKESSHALFFDLNG